MVYHLSSDEEKNVFLSLNNNKERDLFIQAFWLQRDPTPGTTENEYRKEVEKRFEYVQEYFSRSSSKPGWMTDMGKFYMILGKPNSIERFDNVFGMVPAQVWYFYGDATLGLPSYFNVTFFKPNNTTEWKFYNPYTDGPAALLMKQDGLDETSFESVYEKIKEYAPALAMPSLTMVPNEIGPDFHPTLRTNLLIANIYESPKKKINANYASDFLNYKGYVDVESSINYIESSRMVSICRYGSFRFNFVNFSLKPKRISMDYNKEKDQYYFNYEFSVNLRQGDKFIYEYKKNFDMYLDPANVNSLKGNGLVIHDTFPVIPGKYKLTVFAMNQVGKEFTYFEQDIVVPPVESTPVLSTPVIGYRVEEQPDLSFYPYNYANKKLYVDTDRNIRLKDNAVLGLGVYNLDNATWESGKVEITVKGQSERSPYTWSNTLLLKDFPFRENIDIIRQIGDSGMNSDYYDVDIRLVDGAGKVIDTKHSDFSVAPVVSVSYAQETYKKMRADNPFYFQYILGTQYEKAGNLEEAEKYYSKALESNVDFKEGYVAYLGLLNKLKKYTQVLVEVEKLRGDQKMEFDYHLIKATAYFGMKDYNEAKESLLRANTIYNSDTRVLNLLGFTMLQLKDPEEAEKVFKASLTLDSNQPFIKKVLEDITKKKTSAPGK